MSQDAAPDPAEVPHGDGSADITETDCTQDRTEDGSAADNDDQGLRWAALLAAFIDDALSPGPGAPPDGATGEPPAPGTA
ncbi:hypothetical protein PV376_11325 [Streptomyces sp. NRRL_ISP-5395]|uniref:hypothetical protein n=1 Tax=Streptomyces TaxID=1883 RepID=UPI000A3AB8A9|nr:MULTISPECIES: hypothetical protein [Streptomyces]MDX2670092.1 hypothetical protein [Streptomyces sp. NRRL_ISP-5395]QXQ98385.1 hypothetical protein KV381_20000 [Streptomyces sp. WY228]GHF89890.1 hypothetical protein GCM10010504_67890 [Streptomyces griseus]